MQNNKSKLRNIFQSAKYCGICLEELKEGEMYDLNHRFDEGDVDTVTLHHIICEIFGIEISRNILSNYLCKICRDSVTSAYSFIKRAKYNIKLTELYLMQLFNKSEEFISYYTNNSRVKKRIIFILEKPNDDILYNALVESQFKERDYKNVVTETKSLDNINRRSTRKKNANKNVGESIVDLPIVVEYSDTEATDDNYSQCDSYDINNPKQLFNAVTPLKTSSEALKCLLCGIIFQSTGTYFQHMMNEHPQLDCAGDNLLTCEQCQKQFRYREALFKHLDKHDSQKKYKCVICKVICKSKNMFLRHMKSSKHNLKEQSFKTQPKIKECSVCHQKFDDSALFKSHMANHGPSAKHKCELCDVEFETRIQYMRHIRCSEHKNRLDPSKKMSRLSLKPKNRHCSICQMKFNSYGAVRKHMLIHKPDEKHKCKPCSLEFNSRQEYILHANTLSHVKMLDTDKKLLFKCDLCEYTTYNKCYFEEHVNIHLGVRCACHICGKQLQNSFSLKRHVEKHYGKKEKTSEKSKRICDLCGKVLCGPTVMKKHMRLHTGERPYKCDECDMGFLSAGHRANHKRIMHMEKSIACPLCGKLFCLLRYMRKHVQKVHWKSTEKFDYRQLKGLTEEEYDLFKDKRKIES